MSITVIYRKKKKKYTFSLTRKTALVFPLLFVSLIIGMAWTIQSNYQSQLTQYKIDLLKENYATKDERLIAIKDQANEQVSIIAAKVGALQAQISRLNALGERVIEKADLPENEFDFDSPIPVGGATNLDIPAAFNLNDLLNNIEILSDQFKNNQNQLEQLEIVLNNHNIVGETYLSGRPTLGRGSWVSSPFGKRIDPFNGKIRSHKGVDIAGYTGMPIISTGAGLVTYSGRRSGYGLMVEINHGNGLSTRYAHALSLDVKVGDVVVRGEVVAKMGSTGRSTGPHVHYEVLRKGHQLDPQSYMVRKAI